GKRQDVIEHIGKDPTLTDAERDAALRYAQGLPLVRAPQTIESFPDHLNNASWYIVRLPDDAEENYQKALKLAEPAVNLEPNNGYYINTLGVAQYRVRDYAEAMKTLVRSDRINSQPRPNRMGGEIREPRSISADLAFLAMASFRLGEKEKALDYLKEL